MALDLSRLENKRVVGPDKTTARCPACALAGGDAKGEHLVIYDSGKYACVANPNDKAHRQEIFRLVGKATKDRPAPVRLSVRSFQAPASTVLMDLGSFARFTEDDRWRRIPTANPSAAQAGQPRRITAKPARPCIGEEPEEAREAQQEE